MINNLIVIEPELEAHKQSGYNSPQIFSYIDNEDLVQDGNNIPIIYYHSGNKILQIKRI